MDIVAICFYEYSFYNIKVSRARLYSGGGRFGSCPLRPRTPVDLPLLDQLVKVDQPDLLLLKCGYYMITLSILNEFVYLQLMTH